MTSVVFLRVIVTYYVAYLSGLQTEGRSSDRGYNRNKKNVSKQAVAAHVDRNRFSSYW